MSMDKNLCCIVVPVYKTTLTKYEIMSLKQCCKILKNYPIVFITHNKLDCSVYDEICKKFGVLNKYQYFKQIYFCDLHGYNALMLSRIFYKRFEDYRFILIYQLDAYVFNDELEYWCNMGYDYIGAPWLEINGDKPTPKFSNPSPVGNGGFSLRNTSVFIRCHTLKIGVKWFVHLFASYYKSISHKSKKKRLYFIPRIPLYFMLRFLKWIFFRKDEWENNNEDKVWSIFLQKKRRLPDTTEAMKFSFENFPEFLYGLNSNTLPFGCHAWYKYDNYDFFKKHITEEQVEIS
jgi:hypothetical protein